MNNPKMKFTEEMANQIHDIGQLRYALICMIQKKNRQSKKTQIRKKKIKDLRLQLKNSKDKIKQLNEEINEINFHRYDSAFEKIRGDFNEYYFTNLFQLVQNLGIFDKVSSDSKHQFDSIFVAQLNSFRENLTTISNDQRKFYEDLLTKKNVEIENLNHKIEAITDQLETAINSPISQDLERLIAEKDSAIEKLKGMLQSSVDSDKRKQQQLEEQHKEIQKLHELLHSAYQPNNNTNFVTKFHVEKDVEYITRLERKVTDLESRISNSLPSVELQEKNERLLAMIEKSNTLYAQATDTIQKLKFQISEQNNKDNQPLAMEITFQFDNSFNSIDNLPKTQHLRPKKSALIYKTKLKKLKHTYRAYIASLRQTLLQFFLKDEASKISLVPVILQLVGCTQDQVSTVMLKIQSNQRLANQSGGFFGLFRS